MNRVFIYWDNSNIFHEVQRLAEDILGVVNEEVFVTCFVRQQLKNPSVRMTLA